MNGISVSEATRLIEVDDSEILALITRADRARRRFFGNKIATCAIVNAKSGNCGEDCKFCPQSIHSDSDIRKYPLMSQEALLDAAKRAETMGADSFSIVVSGRSFENDRERAEVIEVVRKMTVETTVSPCASLGTVDEAFLRSLRNAGLRSYHHNLEAAESFYSEICTTRTYQDNVDTVKAAKKVGLTICSGCLFGLGESSAQRVELLDALRELDVDSIPVNFLHPLDGTPIKKMNPTPLSPLECLRIIAVARLMMPDKTIRVCGGRERNLRGMQSWIFAAGANALMIGSYLTTSGRDAEDDMRMIEDAGFELEEDA